MEDGARLQEQLPPAFLRFLHENEIDPVEYSAADDLPRYFRTNPKCARVLTHTELIEEFGASVQPIVWLPSFYSLKGSASLSNATSYKEAAIYGLDVASGVAVALLDPQRGDHVLDLCCAPGAKLCFIYDRLAAAPEGDTGTAELVGSVTGVDCDEQRLSACRSICKKYSVRARLIHHDGRTFDAGPLEAVEKAPDARKRKRKQRNKGSQHPQVLAEAAVAEAAEQAAQAGAPRLLYDKVLVDAECTHDGSIRHLQKYREQWGWETLEARFLDPHRVATITTLQSELLENGFRLLKPDGKLVYSTCSLSRLQNEAVVEAFMKRHVEDAVLLGLEETVKGMPCRRGIGKGPVAHGTVRFDPTTSGTSGLYIAMLSKKVQIKGEHCDEFIKIMSANAVGSRAERGCRRFDLLRDQSDPCRFATYEVFESAEALKTHMEMPYVKAWGAFQYGEKKPVLHKQVFRADGISITTSPQRLSAPNAANAGAPPPLAVFLQVTIKEAHRDEFIKIMKADAAGSRTEVGCVLFDFWCDQSDPCKFATCEVFAAAGALQTHMEMPYVKAWGSFQYGEAKPVAAKVVMKAEVIDVNI